jgi:methylamine dehydrogenase accessory protein MauD
MAGLELTAEVLQWVVLLAVAVMVAGLTYLVTDINRRLGPDFGVLVPSDGLEIGTEAPALVASDVRNGRTVSLSEFEGQPVIVAFLSPSCGPCTKLVPHLNRLAGERREVPMIAVLTGGEHDGRGEHYARELSGRIEVVGDADKELERAYEVQRTPLVYLINDEGRIATRTISNDLVDLEDTLGEAGRPQGSASWVALEEPTEEPAPAVPAGEELQHPGGAKKGNTND